jgi:NAD(P)H-dependent FMN reductase
MSDNNIKLLAMAGSSRNGALSGRLLHAALEVARTAGAEVTPVDLRSLALPVYDGDLEASQGAPEGAKRLRDLFASHDALLYVTPEYNGFPTPLFINAFDWLSRVPAEGEKPSGLAATALKVAGLLSSSPGPLGGLRSLNFTRQYLSMAFGMLVVPQQFALGQANNAFDDSGALKEPKQQHIVSGVVNQLLKVAAGQKSLA